MVWLLVHMLAVTESNFYTLNWQKSILFKDNLTKFEKILKIGEKIYTTNTKKQKAASYFMPSKNFQLFHLRGNSHFASFARKFWMFVRANRERRGHDATLSLNSSAFQNLVCAPQVHLSRETAWLTFSVWLWMWIAPKKSLLSTESFLWSSLVRSHKFSSASKLNGLKVMNLANFCSFTSFLFLTTVVQVLTLSFAMW